jgi:hypothetical protein
MRLAIVQMVLGALVTVFAFISTLGHPITEFTLPADESGTVTTILINPVPDYYQLGALVAMLLGLAVVGCGIAQLLKARGSKRATAL